jgi:hypothetical protein
MRAFWDPFSFVVLTLAGWMSRQQQEVIAYLIEENRVLREQIGNRRLRFNNDQRRRLAAKAKKLGRKTLGEVSTIAAPETLLSWHRKLIVQNYDGSPSRTLGRRPTRKEIAALVVRMAEENRSWGYRRIQGALANLGHELAHNTIGNILKRHGLEPSPERVRKTTWKEFLQRHWEQIVASGFFSMDLRTRSVLHRFVILAFMKLSTRRVEIARIARRADSLSITQVARNLTDHMDGLCKRKRDLIAEERPRIRCPYEENEQGFRSGLIMLLAASNRKAGRVKRPQRLDRLLNYCREAA